MDALRKWSYHSDVPSSSSWAHFSVSLSRSVFRLVICKFVIQGRAREHLIFFSFPSSTSAHSQREESKNNSEWLLCKSVEGRETLHWLATYVRQRAPVWATVLSRVTIKLQRFLSLAQVSFPQTVSLPASLWPFIKKHTPRPHFAFSRPLLFLPLPYFTTQPVHFIIIMSFSRALLLLTILAAISLPSAFAIKCWKCNSETDKFCEQVPAGPVNNDTDIPSCLSKLYEDCPDDGLKYFCRKQTQVIKDQKRVIRGCGFDKSELECYQTKTPLVATHVCQCFEDGCNGSHSLTLGIFTIIAAFLFNRLLLHWSCIFDSFLKMFPF